MNSHSGLPSWLQVYFLREAPAPDTPGTHLPVLSLRSTWNSLSLYLQTLWSGYIQKAVPFHHLHPLGSSRHISPLDSWVPPTRWSTGFGSLVSPGHPTSHNLASSKAKCFWRMSVNFFLPLKPLQRFSISFRVKAKVLVLTLEGLMCPCRVTSGLSPSVSL